MKRGLIIGLSVLLAGIAVWLFLSTNTLGDPSPASSDTSPTSGTQAPAAHPTDATAASRDTDAPDPSAAGETAASNAWPLHRRLHNSDDLFAFAQSIREAATSGDPAAMWTLGLIYDSCELLAVKYGDADSLASARQAIDVVTAAMPPPAASYHRRQFERCRGFVEQPEQLENAEIWQTLAAEAGHPAAQLRVWVDKRLDADLGPPSLNRVATLVETGQPDALMLAPLLLEVESGEPEPTASAINDTAWALAICQLGVDCGPQSELTRLRCIWDACAPGDDLATSLETHVSPYIFQQAQEHAARLAAAIRQGDLANSGLVSLSVAGPALTQ